MKSGVQLECLTEEREDVFLYPVIFASLFCNLFVSFT